MGSKLLRLWFLPLMALHCLLSGYLFSDEPPIDFEMRIQDFVLETKRIEIPGYPLAFNPAIIRWQGSLLLSFRIIPNPKDSFVSYLGVVWLDDDFNPITEPQILDFRQDRLAAIPSRAADARMIAVGDTLYMVYEDNTEMALVRGGFRVYVAELLVYDRIVEIKSVDCLAFFEGADRNLREKSWVPFEYCNSLLLAYSINPHTIFYPVLGTGSCYTLAKTQADIDWPWGELRGGTPGLQINDHSYLSFFHSSIYMETVHSKGKHITHYFIGAYLFSTSPPFALTHMSPEPIYSKNFYSGTAYKPYWKPIKAVFPCGYVMDDQYIWIAYGRDDYETWIVKLDKEGLLRSLIPLKGL